MLIETPVSNTRFLVYLQVYLKRVSRYAKYKDIKDSEFARIAEFRPLPVVDVSSLETGEVLEPERLVLEGGVSSLEDERSSFQSILDGFVSASDWADEAEFAHEPKFAPVSSQEVPTGVSGAFGVSKPEEEDWVVSGSPELVEESPVELEDGWGDVLDGAWGSEPAHEPDDEHPMVESDDEHPVVEPDEGDVWIEDEEGGWDSDSDEGWDSEPVESEDEGWFEGDDEEDDEAWVLGSEPAHEDDSDEDWEDTWVSEPDVEPLESSSQEPDGLEPTKSDLFIAIFDTSYVPKRPPFAYTPKKRVSSPKSKPKPAPVVPTADVIKPVVSEGIGKSFVKPPPPPVSTVSTGNRFDRMEFEDVVAYTRRLVRVSEDIAIQHFSPKEIEQALSTGKVLRRRGVLIFSHN